MDPFEVRIRFTSMLQSLNASVTSANKTAQYALKYRDMDEDLHSCILEQLERVCMSLLHVDGGEQRLRAMQNSMNNRANIMYFIEHLCDMAARENHQDYVRMIQRDILRVVDAVAPEDGSGAANVKVVRKVLQGLQLKAFLMAQTVSEIEECLKDRDVQPDAIGLSSPLQQDVEMNGTDAPTLSSQHTPLGQSKSKGANGVVKLDKRQIEQRIEEDRERHKRLRENIWAVPGGLDGENLKSWGETSDAGDDDYILYDEEKDERRAANREWKDERRSRTVVHGD